MMQMQRKWALLDMLIVVVAWFVVCAVRAAMMSLFQRALALKVKRMYVFYHGTRLKH